MVIAKEESMVLCDLPYRGLLVSPLVSADGKEERSLYVDRDKRRPMSVVYLDHSCAAAQQIPTRPLHQRGGFSSSVF